MASKTSASGADTPTNPPAEPKANDNDVAPNNPINKIPKQSKPDINSAHKAALPSHQPLTLRKAPQNANKASAASGHKRNKSDDSTSSMQVSLSDRDDDPSPERIPNPEPRSVIGAEDTAGIGCLFPS